MDDAASDAWWRDKATAVLLDNEYQLAATALQPTPGLAYRWHDTQWRIALPSLPRRYVLQAGAVLGVGLAPQPASAQAFSVDTVAQVARDLARQRYQPPDTVLPGPAASMTYDQYQGIRFRQQRALWADRGLPFQVAFFPRGFLFQARVDVHEVVDGKAIPVSSSADLFDFDDPSIRPSEDLGFAGLRIHAEINRPGTFDEFCVFLGASYFRAVGRDQLYGLSARGLAIDSGGATPEEFPRFRAFWLERPKPADTVLVLHALLDSPSVTGAFRFAIKPGGSTTMDVQARLFPRTDIARPGIAPLTSMYFFSPRDRVATNDWRTAVHDSDGLVGAAADGNRVWRPLANPDGVQVSAIPLAEPRFFGLVQRRRAFEDYGDLQVLYEKRPDLIVEPRGSWGSGAVEVVELPTGTEYADNIVAFWRPGEPLRAGKEYPFEYGLDWGVHPEGPAPLPGLARVVSTSTGAGTAPGTRVFVLDLLGGTVGTLAQSAPTHLNLASSAGRLSQGYSGPNPETGGWRISLEFDPAGATVADLRCTLLGQQGPLAETWLFRWQG